MAPGSLPPAGAAEAGPLPPGPVLLLVPSLVRAGAETQVISLANGLARAGVQVHLATFGENLDQHGRIDHERVQFHHLRRGGRLGLGLIGALAGLLRRHRFTVVHCTLQVSLFYAFAARLLCGLRRPPALVLAVHTTLNRSVREERFDRWLYRPLFAACERLVFVCHAQAEYWYGRFPELRGRSAVVYNGIDADYFRPGTAEPAAEALRRTCGIPAEAPLVLCVARLRPEKGHDLLLAAFAALGEDCPAHLLLAGDGEMRAQVLAQRDRLGLAGRVHLLGDVADTRPCYAAASVTVLASTSVETFSMAMLESLAMEVPMIASDIGGMREAILPGETGWLTPPGDVAALRQALAAAIGDAPRTRALGAAGRARVLAEFTVPRMVAVTARLLAQTAARSSGGMPRENAA
jgi:glycosyltransferase involved in cell wall biosynthesis